MPTGSLLLLLAGLVLAAGCSMSNQERGRRNTEWAEEVNNHLMAVVIEPFYPRAIDKERGGYNQVFDRNWVGKAGGTGRFVVFQARATYSAAALATERKGLAARYRPYAEHGFKELRDVLWDKQYGGFYWGAQADGSLTPEYGDQKLAYGQVFAIFACAQHYAATKDPAALELARKGFRWFEDHARDRANGGYFECMNRDGSRLGKPGDAATTQYGGWPFGLKTSNSSVHVLEAYLKLYEVDPEPEVRARLSDIFLQFRDRIILPETGTLGETFQDDWTPASRKDSYGHDVEAAHLMLSAAKALGLENDSKTEKVTKRLVDHALDHGFDWDSGGLYDNVPEGASGSRRPKTWWAQAENLLALVVMHERYGKDTDRYLDALKLQWRCITRDFTDRDPVGRIKAIAADGAVDRGKIDDWTETYHDTRCLLAVANHLRALKQ